MSEKVQYHFVVMFDAEDGVFELDYESQSTMFRQGPVFNKETQEWRRLHDSEWEEDGTTYNNAGDSLAKMLRELTERWI
jgi:predicted KAP-like P-loop ATPase